MLTKKPRWFQWLPWQYIITTFHTKPAKNVSKHRRDYHRRKTVFYMSFQQIYQSQKWSTTYQRKRPSEKSLYPNSGAQAFNKKRPSEISIQHINIRKKGINSLSGPCSGRSNSFFNINHITWRPPQIQFGLLRNIHPNFHCVRSDRNIVNVINLDHKKTNVLQQLLLPSLSNQAKCSCRYAG